MKKWIVKEIANKTYGRTFYSKLFASTFNSSFWFQQMNQVARKKYEKNEEEKKTRTEEKFFSQKTAVAMLMQVESVIYSEWQHKMCIEKKVLLLHQDLQSVVSIQVPVHCGSFIMSTIECILIYRYQTAYHCKLTLLKWGFFSQSVLDSSFDIRHNCWITVHSKHSKDLLTPPNVRSNHAQ